MRSIIGRTFGGLALGGLLGIVVFAVERGAGWLGGDGWRTLASWLMLPLFAFAGAAVLGFTFAIGGIRRAAIRLLIDSGALDRVADRVPRSEGWIGKQLRRLVTTMARDKIESWYAIPVYLTWAVLAVVVVVPPLLI